MGRFLTIYQDVGWTTVALLIFFISFFSILVLSFLKSSQQRFEVEKWLPLEKEGSREQ